MSVWSSIRLILTLTCEESSHLVSDSLDRDLGWAERVAVRAHLMICRSCRRFRHQVMLLHQAARRWGTETTDSGLLGSKSLGHDVRRRITDALRDR